MQWVSIFASHSIKVTTQTASRWMPVTFAQWCKSIHSNSGLLISDIEFFDNPGSNILILMAFFVHSGIHEQLQHSWNSDTRDCRGVAKDQNKRLHSPVNSSWVFQIFVHLYRMELCFGLHVFFHIYLFTAGYLCNLPIDMDSINGLPSLTIDWFTRTLDSESIHIYLSMVNGSKFSQCQNFT